jgi:nitroreductase
VTPLHDPAYRLTVGLRAVRSYTDEPIEGDDLEAILEAGRWTGSSRNSQPWELVVLTGEEARRRISGCGRFAAPVAAAPVAVVLVARPGSSSFDIGRLAQNMMLAAAALGIGSCPVTLHDEQEARKALGVPDDHHCRYALAFGWPSSGKPPVRVRVVGTLIPKGRRPLNALVHWERFGARTTGKTRADPRTES